MASAAVAVLPVVEAPREEILELNNGAPGTNTTAAPRPVPAPTQPQQQVAEQKNCSSSSSSSSSCDASSELRQEESLAAAGDEPPPLLTGPTAASDDIEGAAAAGATPTGVVVRRHSKLAPYKPGKMTVVLDMDECLLHSKFHGPGAASEAYRQNEERPDAVNELGVNSFWVALDDGDTAQVNKRPGLDPFLEALARDYNTIVFTAAMPDYAGPVLDYIDPKGTLFHRRLYRSSCRQVKGAFLKDLSVLGVDSTDMSRTVLVDNNPLSFICQPTNGVLVASFYDDPADTALASVMQLIRHLDQAGDVRPILKDMFRLDTLLGEYRSALFDDGDEESVITGGAGLGNDPSCEDDGDVSSTGELSDDDLLGEVDELELERSVAPTGNVDKCLLESEGGEETPNCDSLAANERAGEDAVGKDDDDESVKTEACSEESVESSVGESIASGEDMDLGF